MHFLLARQVFRQWLAVGCLDQPLDGGRAFGGGMGFLLVQRVEFQFKLLDLAGDLFRRLAELHPLQLGNARFQLRDLQTLVLDCAQELPHQRLQRIGVLRQIVGIDVHDQTVATIIMIRARAFRRESTCRAALYPASSGLCVRIGARQSIPSRR
jgi:hypothetical protein